MRGSTPDIDIARTSRRHRTAQLGPFVIPALLSVGACQPASPPTIVWREKPALLQQEQIGTNVCVEPSQGERELLEVAVRTLELSEEQGPFGSLDIGAKKVLSRSALLRRPSGGTTAPLCFGTDHLVRVGDALARRGGLGKHRLVEYELELAARLPNPSAQVVDDVAKVAFSQNPSQSAVFVDEDIRPYARAVLATFGTRAAAYGEPAFREMGANSAMATGAAQVATATAQPGALARAVRLFQESLEEVPYPKTIGWHRRNRLYELAWAIAYGGESAREHAPLIRNLMGREVQSHAPPFGMIEHAPKRMCAVLEKVAGPQASREFKYCSDATSFEQ